MTWKFCVLLVISNLEIYLAVPSPTPPLSKEAKVWWEEAQGEVKRALDLQFSNIKRAKNVIFFLGDGLGQATVTAARSLKAHQKGKKAGEESLFVDSFSFTGYSKTYNTDYQVPDSAGTATAYNCGVKANLGTIGIDERVKRTNCSSHINLKAENPNTLDLKCISHFAADAGKGVGIITNQPLTDASPAPLFGHAAERRWWSDFDLSAEANLFGCTDLALQFVVNGTHIDLALAGGFNSFNKIKRVDQRDLPQEWQDIKNAHRKKPKFLRTREDLITLDMSQHKAIFGLFAAESLNYSSWRAASVPTLAELVKRALEFMQMHHEERGYYLFVEGGLIDIAHHNNYGAHALLDTLAFDEAIQVARSMTLHDDTLIVATADHSHVFSYAGYARREVNILDRKPYTNIMYANGPGFRFNLRNFTAPDGRIYQARANLSDPNEKFNISNYRYQYMAAVPLSSETHGGEDVPVFADGPGAHYFIGVHEQHALPHLIYCAACFGPYHPSCPCDIISSGNNGNDPSTGLRIAVYVLAFVCGVSLLSLVALAIFTMIKWNAHHKVEDQHTVASSIDLSTAKF